MKYICGGKGGVYALPGNRRIKIYDVISRVKFVLCSFRKAGNVATYRLPAEYGSVSADI
jgi:hypothetical protein